jgi:hypothetical protein
LAYRLNSVAAPMLVIVSVADADGFSCWFVPYSMPARGREGSLVSSGFGLSINEPLAWRRRATHEPASR